MKQVFILTNEQSEELKLIQTRITFDLDIIVDLLKDESVKATIKNAIFSVLLRIESHCNNMEDILESE